MIPTTQQSTYTPNEIGQMLTALVAQIKSASATIEAEHSHLRILGLDPDRVAHLSSKITGLDQAEYMVSRLRDLVQIATEGSN